MAEQTAFDRGRIPLSDLPATFRLAACTYATPTVEVTLSAKSCIHLASAIERGMDHDRVTIVYRDAPMPRWEAVLHTFFLGLAMFGFMGDAVLALIDLARAVLP